MKSRDEDLSSEFDYESDLERKRKRSKITLDPLGDQQPSSSNKQPRVTKGFYEEEKRKEDGKISRLMCLDAYSRHKQIINDYYLYYPGATKRLERDKSRDKTDIDVIRENQKFLWDAYDEPTTWEGKLAKRYYDKLFKEYCICDLSRYKENKVKRLRLCIDCSYKLNYHHKRKLVVKKSKSKRRTKDGRNGSSSEWEEDFSGKTKKEAETSVSGDDEKKPEKETKFTEDLPNNPDVWRNPVELEEEKSREEEFENFLDDLLL